MIVVALNNVSWILIIKIWFFFFAFFIFHYISGSNFFYHISCVWSVKFSILQVEELAYLVKDNLFCKHLILSTEKAFVDFLQNDRRFLAVHILYNFAFSFGVFSLWQLKYHWSNEVGHAGMPSYKVNERWASQLAHYLSYPILEACWCLKEAL